MNWSRETDYNLRSDCKQYSVAKYGTAEGWRYEAWHRHTPIQLKTGMLTADEAKAVCVAHKREQRRVA